MTRFKKISLLLALNLLITISVIKAQDELRILPLGNSLTYGYYDGTKSDGERIGYRYELYNLLTNAGYNFDFVGHRQTGYSIFSDAQHAGIPGIHDNQVGELLELGRYYTGVWNNVYSGPYLEHQPADVILLHIGTNDIFGTPGDDYNYVTGIERILDAIDDYENSPGGNEVLVLLAKIINVKNSGNNCNYGWEVSYFNNDVVEPAVQTRITNGDKIVMVDMQCGAGINYNADMLNQLHPNQNGYDKMGQMWFNTLDGLHTAPTISPITVDPIAEGESFPVISLDNYISDDYTTDADITWTVSPSPTNLNVSINSGRQLTVTPKVAGWTGTEQITLVAKDKGRYIQKLAKTATVNVSFSIDDVNTVPVILTQTGTLGADEDNNFTVSLSDFEIEDDNDPGDFVLNILSGANYTSIGNTVYPAENFDGELTVNVAVSDGILTSETFEASATITPVNDAPEIVSNSTIEMNEDDSRTIVVSDMVIEDPDNTPDQLTIHLENGSNYSVFGNTITPDPDYFGNLSVNVRVRDNSLYSNMWTLTVHVNPVNDPPQILSTPVTESNDYETYSYAIEAEDLENDVITYRGIQIPNWLDIDPVSGNLSGTPMKEDTGSYRIIVGADDGTDVTTQEYDLYIAHNNIAPVFITEPDTIVPIGENYSYTVKANDEDDDNVKYIGIKVPYFLSFLSSNGILVGTPTESNEGVHEVILGAADGSDTTLQSFLLYVGDPDLSGSVIYNDERINVYPNPANQILNVAIAEQISIERITILELSGRVVYQQTIPLGQESTISSINISHLSEGSYILIIQDDDISYTHKLSISR